MWPKTINNMFDFKLWGPNALMIKKWELWAIPVLALSGYWSTLDNSFGLDDFDFVGRLAGGEGLASFSNILGALRFIRPIGALLFYFDYWIYGTWAPGYHITNILIHILNGYLLIAVIRHLWPSIAGLAGCLFVIAPFTVEGVAWISARFDLLMAFWFLLGILALLKDRPWIGAGAFGLAMLSKEPALTAPVIAISIALWRRNTMAKRLKLAIPTVVIALLYLGFRIWLYNGIGGYNVGQVDLVSSLYRWIPINARNLLQLFASPVSHKVTAALPKTHLFGFLWLVPWLGLFCPQCWRVPLAVGIAFFLVTYAPTAFVPLSTFGVTWRFIYLPSAGLALGAAWAVSQLPWRKSAIFITIVVWLLVLHINLVLWESASFHIKRLATEIKSHIPYQGCLRVVVPASFAGAYMAPGSVVWMGRFYRPDITVIGLTEKEALRVPIEFSPSIIFPRPMLCFPSFGKHYCPRALPYYYQHPSWKFEIVAQESGFYSFYHWGSIQVRYITDIVFNQ